MRCPNGASRRERFGFTLIELIIVVFLIGTLAAVAIPRLRPSAALQVRSAAAQTVNDLELARTRAMTTRRPARLAFDVTAAEYTGYLGTAGTPIGQTLDEMEALHGFGVRPLEGKVRFGRGMAPMLPNDPGSGEITIPDQRIDFNSRGMTVPFGTRGTIYFHYETDPEAAAAVSINPAGSFRIWHYIDGVWQ
jgi:prepilin-type N-terminal cleavage/methylation domain-containing protein